jgi:hypothetical protein
MPTRMVVTPPCAVCGAPSSRIELVPPGELPAGSDAWPEDRRESWQRHRDPSKWYLIFEGVAAGNGSGDAIDADYADRLAKAFRQPLSYAQVHTAGLHDDAGFCEQCEAPYCYQHWNMQRYGTGFCPEGHHKSLDPLWSPDE